MELCHLHLTYAIHFLFSYRMCPIFQISNVTGENMDLLKMFLNLLSSRTTFSNDEPAEFQIDDTYSVPVCNKHSIKRNLIPGCRESSCSSPSRAWAQ